LWDNSNATGQEAGRCVLARPRLNHPASFIETRLKVANNRYRVPDVCVYLGHEPDEQVFTGPPFLCVEILSPEDRMSRTMTVVQDYLAMGVKQVWIFDPWKKKALAIPLVCDW
jgi:Uma2 family endonuclease